MNTRTHTDQDRFSTATLERRTVGSSVPVWQIPTPLSPASCTRARSGEAKLRRPSLAARRFCVRVCVRRRSLLCCAEKGAQMVIAERACGRGRRGWVAVSCDSRRPAQL